MLYMPAGWGHTARVVSDEPSVTITGSFVGEDNYESFVDAPLDFVAAQSLQAKEAITIQ